MRTSQALLIAAIACGFAAGAVQAGSGEPTTISSRPGASARLIINRAANFGTEEHFLLYIDGVHVANIGYNRSYEGVLPAGEHLVTIRQVPHLNDAYPFHQQLIKQAPGRTSVFTATWRSGGTRAVLEES